MTVNENEVILSELRRMVSEEREKSEWFKHEVEKLESHLKAVSERQE